MLNLFILQYNLMPWFWNLTRQWQATYLGSKFQGEVLRLLLPVSHLTYLDNAFRRFLLRRSNPLDFNEHPLVTLFNLCHRRKIWLQ